MPDISIYAREKYLPAAKDQRSGIALCLSGGGYRATLFHLGALRRLNELGILAKLTTVSSVSGGSITAGYIASTIPWPLSQPLPPAEWQRITEGLAVFTRRDIRTPSVLKRFIPTNWFKSSTGVEALAAQYQKHLTSKTLSELPNRPNFVFCSTDMAFGVNWVFEKGKTGSYQAGYCKPPPSDWRVARAVAASSCFPPVFNPLPIGLGPAELTGGRYPAGAERDAIISDLRLTDGGVYDNLGLEPVWKDHAIVLVSDGGALFDFEADRNLIWRLKRYIAITGNQAEALRKRWFISQCISNELAGTYWGIGSARTSYDPKDTFGYSKVLARQVIAEIRTDLDRFSDAESAVLQNHGYLLGDIAIKTHVKELLPKPVPDLQIPYPDWLDERRVREALANSNKRKIFG